METINSLLSWCPADSEHSIDWQRIEASSLAPYFQKMAETPQQPEYHGEGDVWTHTKLVCQRLVELHDFWHLTECQRQALFIAALLHDIAKPQTTREQDGKIVAPRHGPIGAQMVRRLLWQEFDMAGSVEKQQMRETICQLIRYHTAPPNVMTRDDPELFLRKLAANGHQTPDFTIHMLCLLAEADVLGRIAYDTQELCDMVHLCAAQAEESGCLHGPYAFPNSYTEHAYLSGRNVQPDVPLYDDTWGEVMMLCALPGTGKDTWIARNCAGMPVLSLDDIRRSRGVKPTDDQGRIIQEGKQRAKELLASHQPFVFNGTNVTDMMRGKWAQLFEQYHARVRMVYLETAWEENMRRNAARPYDVPESVIGGLLEKLTPPEQYEAQTVEWKTV